MNTIDDIDDAFSNLIDTAKTVANTVTVCSILPTVNGKNKERRDKVNDLLRKTCAEKEAIFVDNDFNFTYRDGSCDDAAFGHDGVHLSGHGLSKLMRNDVLVTHTTPRAKNDNK